MMNNKNILLLSPFFFPEPISTGKYNTLLALALASDGASVEVIASHPLYPDWKPEVSSETVEGVSIRRGGGNVRYPKRAVFRRIVLELWFALYALGSIRAIRRSGAIPDLVLPVFPPSLFFIGCCHALPSRVKKVGIVHDLQGVHASNGKGVFGLILGRAINLVEKKAFGCCDRLIFLSGEMMHLAIEQLNIRPERCEVVYPPAWLDPAADQVGTELAGLFPHGYRHVVYSGALGEKQNPAGLVELFLAAAAEMGGIMFHIFSRGPEFDRLKAVHESKASVISFHDLVPKSQLVELYHRSDIQIIPQRAGTSGGSLPSKLPNLLAAGVRILSITDAGSELENILAEAEGVVTTISWGKEGFISALAVLLGDKRTHAERSELNRALLERHFSMDALVSAIYKVLDS